MSTTDPNRASGVKSGSPSGIPDDLSVALDALIAEMDALIGRVEETVRSLGIDDDEMRRSS